MDDLAPRLAPVLAGVGLELVDLEVRSGLVRVLVDRVGGVDLEALSEANRLVSHELDLVDPFPGRYTLEVSSPGLERPLRSPAHFARAASSKVTVRTRPGTEPRRVTGTLTSVGEVSFVVVPDGQPDACVELRFDQVERARTVFEWGPAPKPGKASGSRGGRRDSRGRGQGPLSVAGSRQGDAR